MEEWPWTKKIDYMNTDKWYSRLCGENERSHLNIDTTV